MPFCSKCGAELRDNDAVCSKCNEVVDAQPQPQPQQVYSYESGAQPGNANNNNGTNERPSGKIDTGSLVWAICNLAMCCMPLGIAGLVITIQANNATTRAEEKSKLKTVKTLNIIGTCGGALAVLLYIILIAAGAMQFAQF